MTLCTLLLAFGTWQYSTASFYTKDCKFQLSICKCRSFPGCSRQQSTGCGPQCTIATVQFEHHFPSRGRGATSQSLGLCPSTQRHQFKLRQCHQFELWRHFLDSNRQAASDSSTIFRYMNAVCCFIEDIAALEVQRMRRDYYCPASRHPSDHQQCGWQQ